MTVFKVYDHSYKVLYDPKYIRRRKSNDFPQCHDHIYFISKTQGTHPSRFIPDFASNDTKLDVGAGSTFGSVLNIQPCLRKLKAPTHSSAIVMKRRARTYSFIWFGYFHQGTAQYLVLSVVPFLFL